MGEAKHGLAASHMIKGADYFRDANLQMVQVNIGTAAVAQEFPAPILRVIAG
jgi:hypothetical protein